MFVFRFFGPGLLQFLVDCYDLIVENGALADRKQVILRAERTSLRKGARISGTFFELKDLYVLFELFLNFLHVQKHLLVYLMQSQDSLPLHSLVCNFLSVGQVSACKRICCFIGAVEANCLQVALFAQQNR